jgi:3-oxoacyl-(acyl-carrier-protein) synthase
MDKQIVIRGLGAVSSLGFDAESALQNMFTNTTCIRKIQKGNTIFWGASLSEEAEKDLQDFLQLHKISKEQDRTVHLALAAAFQAINQTGWKNTENIAVSMGSSRGATGVWEAHYDYFKSTHQAKLKTSPLTTLGNISSQVADFIGATGLAVEQSVTCSTGFMALLQGIAWLQSGMATRVLAGATEAPLTAFTVAQMKALKIYSELSDPFPCMPLYLGADKKNSMVLGEGAVALALELAEQQDLIAGDLIISGWGIFKESGNSLTGISPDGKGFQQSMLQAMEKSGVQPDVILMHAPGTLLGDTAEWEAVKKVFGSKIPYVTSQKWKTGHTLGASGLLNLQCAAMILKYQQIPVIPYSILKKTTPASIRHILINTMGFGGNTVSIMVSKF